MSIGPVEYVIIGFPGNQFTGQIVPELAKLIDSGLVRIIDLTFIMKDADGGVEVVEYDAVDPLHEWRRPRSWPGPQPTWAQSPRSGAPRPTRTSTRTRLPPLQRMNPPHRKPPHPKPPRARRSNRSSSLPPSRTRASLPRRSSPPRRQRSWGSDRTAGSQAPAEGILPVRRSPNHNETLGCQRSAPTLTLVTFTSKGSPRPKTSRAGLGRALILMNMFRLAVRLAPAAAGALSAVLAYGQPGGARG